jgi:hypothetical protein
MCDALAVATHPIKGSRSISYSARPSRGACSEASLYFTGVFCPIPTDRTVIYRCFTVSLWEFAMLLRSIWAILSPNVAWTMLHACVSKEPVLYPSCFMVFEGSWAEGFDDLWRSASLNIVLNNIFKTCQNMSKLCSDLQRFNKEKQNTGKKETLATVPIGSMYGIYANIWGILMVNVTIYSIHGSYGVRHNGWFWDLSGPNACHHVDVTMTYILGPHPPIIVAQRVQ